MTAMMVLYLSPPVAPWTENEENDSSHQKTIGFYDRFLVIVAVIPFIVKSF